MPLAPIASECSRSAWGALLGPQSLPNVPCQRLPQRWRRLGPDQPLDYLTTLEDVQRGFFVDTTPKNL